MIEFDSRVLAMSEREAKEQGAYPLQIFLQIALQTFGRVESLLPGKEQDALLKDFDQLRIQAVQEDFLTWQALQSLEKTRQPALIYKGFHLSHFFYPYPYLRPHLDVDLLVPEKTKSDYFQHLTNLNFEADAISGEGVLFCQKSFHQKLPLSSESLVIDLHWEFSNRIFFRSILSFEELWNHGVVLRKNWDHIKVPSPVYALLIACLHPAMHHYNEFPEIWKMDIRLICESLSSDEEAEFYALAVQKRVVALCKQALRVSEARLLKFEELCSLEKDLKNEPSILFLHPDRSWLSDVFADLKFLPSVSERFQYLLQIALPEPQYMVTVYLDKVALRFPFLRFFFEKNSKGLRTLGLWILYGVRAFTRTR